MKTGATGPSVANGTTLCLSNSRYQVQAQWATSDGASGAGHVINLTGDTGAFWFFSPSNVEVVVKVLNAGGVNGRYWTFAGCDRQRLDRFDIPVDRHRAIREVVRQGTAGRRS